MSGNNETSDKIAARGALLDFHSDRCVAFGGFFIAAIFGLLTVLTLVQNINCINFNTNIIIIAVSLVVYSIFGYIGGFILRGFSHYAKIANMLEGGKGLPGDLREFAKLEEMKFKNSDDTENDMRKFIDDSYKVREKSLGKWFLSSSKRVLGGYLSLLILLGIVAYVPLICKIFGF